MGEGGGREAGEGAPSQEYLKIEKLGKFSTSFVRKIRMKEILKEILTYQGKKSGELGKIFTAPPRKKNS